MDHSMKELLELAGEGGIGCAVLKAECAEIGATEEAMRAQMDARLQAMRDAVQEGMRSDIRSLSGMSGGQAARLMNAVASGKTVGGNFLGKAAVRAMTVAECNACMGRIVAVPTAGSCRILPAALLTLQEERDLSDEALADTLFTAEAVGEVIARRASISGAKGGCQAECGSAAAMTAAALVELGGGSPEMCATACSLALGGITLPIPPDEVIDAMKAVGDIMPSSLREMGEGGVAACPSAKAFIRGKTY